MKIKILIILNVICTNVFFGQITPNKMTNNDFLKQDSLKSVIIKKHVYDCDDKINYTFEMYRYQKCIDKGIEKDSTIAYLWQQKAMPYFKAKKYQVGMKFLDKAVALDEERWLPYRGFIKCIFSKEYKEAIKDFKYYIDNYYNAYIMDHTCAFYIGLCSLQINDFVKAEIQLKNEISQEIDKGRKAHHLDVFYYGISKYEQQKWEEAIIEFNKSLALYNEFSDVEYYKAFCLLKTGKKKEARELMKKAKKDAKNGYTINEDNIIYETYPYKVR